MQTHTFHISYALSDQASRDMSTLLLRIPGVAGARCRSGADQIAVNFNEGQTSVQEIEATIVSSGYRVVPEAATASVGSCCGGCGGGGH